MKQQRVLVAALAGLSLAALAVTLVSTWQAGMTWDDAIELLALRDEMNLLRHGAPDYAAAAAGIKYLNAFYGVIPAGLAHLAAWALHIEPAWDVSFAAASYTVRHAVAALFALGGVGVLTWTVWRIWRNATATASLPALLLGLPMFSGHAAINIKDMPVASGLIIVACGLAQAMAGLPQTTTVSRHGVWLVGLGTFITVGTRGGAVALVLAASLLVIAACLAMHRLRALRTMCWILTSIVLATALVAALNPVAWYAPVQWLIDCVRVASSYKAYDGVILVMGRLVRAQAAPWWYVPAWLSVQLPLELVVLAILGLAATPDRRLAWLPFAAVGAALPVLVIISGATLFNALRHLLFMIPPIAVLAAFGTARLARLRPRLAAALVAVMVGECALWAPYQYAYLNPIGLALGGADGFEGDYWGITGREAARRLRAAGASHPIVGPGQTGLAYGAGSQFGDTPDYDGYYAFSFSGRIGLFEFPIPDGHCRRVFVIARFGMRLGEGFRCG